MVPFVPGFEKLQPFLKRIDSKKVYSNFGLLNEELIEKLASYFSIPEEFIATCANATLAITGAVLSSGSPKETEWECPSWTFTATASAIIQSGQALRFRDVDIEGRVIASEGCKALVDVLPFGETFSYDRLPKNINFYVVDAAASFDALRNISFPKNLDVGIVVSMHATKLLPAGEGGIFISNNPQWVSQFKSWTNFGMLGNGDRTSYTVGGNAKLSEYSAAVALASFNDWQITRELVLNQSKKAIALSNFYNLSFSTAMTNGFATPYWIVSLPNAKTKNLLQLKLESDGISHRNWWESGCHKMPAFEKVPRDGLDTTNYLSETTVGLPFHCFLSENDWVRISSSLGIVNEFN